MSEVLLVCLSCFTLSACDVGHSDSHSRNVPTLVKDISGVGQVACGSSHTIAVAQDGRIVWSFGGGDNGMGMFHIKSQHGDRFHHPHT